MATYASLGGARGDVLAIAAPSSQDTAILFGENGNDRLTGLDASRGTVALIGGAGNDTYAYAARGVTFILEDGNDPGDVFIDNLGSAAFDIVYTLEGRHLVAGVRNSDLRLVFIDWEKPENRIERWEFKNNIAMSFAEFSANVKKLPGWLGDRGDLDVQAAQGPDLRGAIADFSAFDRAMESKSIDLAVARLYQAALDRQPDLGGLAFWTGHAKAGLSMERLAQYFVDAPEFAQRFGSLSNAQYVERLYVNVLDRTPDAGGLAYWTQALGGANGLSRAQMLIEFSESRENVAHTGDALVDLVGVPLGWLGPIDFA
jgi:hypothetical protein